MSIAVELAVPISICVVLPVLIVWIVFRSIINKTNKNSEIIIEAIRNNPTIDTEKLIETMKRPEKTPWESLSRKLLRGCIFTLIGVAFAFFGAFLPEEDINTGCWVVCGTFGAVGIGFLITYWFAYKHIDQLTAEKELELKR